jgi:cation-transporting ATPase E
VATTSPGADLSGLTSAEAAARKAAGQSNAVAWQTSRSFGRIVFDNAASPINVVLFAISGVLLALELFGDALLTAGLVLGNVFAGVFQEMRAKRQLDRIALLARPAALVIRDGSEQELPPEEIVLGDYVVVRPGDQIFADGVVVSASGLGVDESLLTGESDILAKRTGDDVVSGSYCLAGSGVYEATRVGGETTASEITVQARQHRTPRTPLQREVGLVLGVMSLVVAFLGIVVARSFMETEGGVPLRETVRAAAVIVALVPQGLAVMVTVSYAMAALRMAGSGVLIQRMNAIESISHVNVLCVDKTGTLTTNRLAVESLHPVGLSEAEFRHALGTVAASASFRNRTADAIHGAFEQPPRRVVDEVAFDSARRWSGLAFEDPDLSGAFVLGAPETLNGRTSGGEALSLQADQQTERGLRVLMLARSPEATSFPRTDGEPSLPNDLKALGLVVLRDETRPDAGSVISEFSEAGIALKIISGDNPDTVASLASQAGLPVTGKTISGTDLEAADEIEVARVARDATIFGRVSPRLKERIVRALRGKNGYVAMVGDGVNDVPALKAAQVAVAMRSGSGITRDIADLVLLNDSFSDLPRAFREGQRIRKGMESIFRVFLTRTLSLTLLILATSLLNDPFPVSPRHTAMIAMLTVGIPTLFLAVWAKPGRTGELVVISGAGFVVPAAVSIALVGLIVYEFLLSTSDDVELARTALTFVATACGLMVLLFLEPPTPAWVAVNPLSGDWRYVALVAGLVGLFAAFVAVPAARDFFELTIPDVWGLAVIGVVVFAWWAALRAFWRSDIADQISRRLSRTAVSAQD